MKPKHKRLWYLCLITLFVSGAAVVMLTTLHDHLLFFMMPTDVMLKNPTTPIRLGGLVVEKSLRKGGLSLHTTFQVTDGKFAIPVHYKGIVPDLFAEGQGVVAEGLWINGIFQATRLLAKHDETYMPRDVAQALKQKGRWRPLQESGS